VINTSLQAVKAAITFWGALARRLLQPSFGRPGRVQPGLPASWHAKDTSNTLILIKVILQAVLLQAKALKPWLTNAAMGKNKKNSTPGAPGTQGKHY